MKKKAYAAVPSTRGYKLHLAELAAVQLRDRLRTLSSSCEPMYWDRETSLVVLEILRLGLAHVYRKPAYLNLIRPEDRP